MGRLSRLRAPSTERCAAPARSPTTPESGRPTSRRRRPRSGALPGARPTILGASAASDNALLSPQAGVSEDQQEQPHRGWSPLARAAAVPNAAGCGFTTGARRKKMRRSDPHRRIPRHASAPMRCASPRLYGITVVPDAVSTKLGHPAFGESEGLIHRPAMCGPPGDFSGSMETTHRNGRRAGHGCTGLGP